MSQNVQKDTAWQIHRLKYSISLSDLFSETHLLELELGRWDDYLKSYIQMTAKALVMWRALLRLTMTNRYQDNAVTLYNKLLLRDLRNIVNHGVFSRG